ncbi:hypothetical protein T265_14550 [Opisthorchis viverrini]|uniref:Fe2OG dioxygenase domain-containing protein n=1 Tax=Opisthorchis viverrini TaxID=6198 RepID=A0A074ZKH5_OPIVI|nr:hypothetical protein T265_14550 [Opisthorchis viverrini]KER23860.1 hypothetical protein T265_14550 [Opisthorchis viverrini]
MSYYEESSGYLKNCFKFYKNLTYDSNHLLRIDESARSIAEACWDVKPSGTVSALPEGLFLLRNVLSDYTLAELLHQSLVDWTCHPSKVSNLDSIHMSNTNTPPDLWSYSSKQIALGKSWDRTPLGKLRWITFGYHYQWSDRRYEESKYGEFPPLLAKISTQIVHLLQTELSSTTLGSDVTQLVQACADFQPEAAIVNYYRGKTNMGFHTDNVEFDKKAPLVSIRANTSGLRTPIRELLPAALKRLGPSALYLWEVSKPVTASPSFLHPPINGGDQPDGSTVIPIVLRHGDVVIMLGKSRLAKHAVPIVLFDEACRDPVLRVAAQLASQRLCPNLCASVDSSNGSSSTCRVEPSYCSCAICKAFVDYVLTTRINMNVRQVIPAGYSFSDFDKK